MKKIIATKNEILTILVQEEINDYDKSISKRIHISRNGGYCCTIFGIQIWQTFLTG